MSYHLPFSVLITYGIFAVFASQQKFCLRDFRGSNQSYKLALAVFATLTSLFGIGFLVYYGFHTTWWAPLLLFAVGLLVYIPFTSLEASVEKFMPLQIWGMLSFIVVPVCAVLLIRFTP